MEIFKQLLQKYKVVVIAHAYTHDPKTDDATVERAWEEMEKAERELVNYVQEIWNELLKC